MKQTCIFDLLETKRASARGMNRAESAADPAWVARVLVVIRHVCARQRTFTGDDIQAEMAKYPERTKDGRALGPLLKKAQGMGLCIPTSTFETSNIVHHHGSPNRVWRSLLLA